jgi:hypothetical protein
MLAAGLTLTVLTVLWFGVASPLIDAYDEAGRSLAARAALREHMRDLVAALPVLEQQAAARAAIRPNAEEILRDTSDAIAGATLANMLEDMARVANTHLTSTEALPGEVVSTSFRRIGLRVTVDAPWRTVVRLFQSIAKSRPRMFVDDLQLRAPPAFAGAPAPDIDGTFTVYALRAAGGPEREPQGERVARRASP